MATLAEIRTWVRTQTLVDTDEMSNTVLLTILNQAIEDVASTTSWPWLEASTTITTVADQNNYSLPADFAKLEALYFDDRDLIVETTRRRAKQVHGTDTTMYPDQFYFYGEEIVFAPTPSTSSLTINLDYQKTPTALSSDSDTPEWHTGFHYIIAEYAAAKVWEREEDLEKVGYHMGAFYDGINRMMMFYASRSEDAPLVIGGSIGPVRYPWDWQRNAS